ncbi:MAG: ABC transporter permease [Thermodesulfobacteriaceae bacterium]|nr:ABC transporter permease [Thermodesulfobacteriaceae bacterium]MCX8042340.1 ABC transporter permease [Thermodesulfobacteriaceae bacterium]MDW8135776.1 ABC transporter permease [Thermodesulfobacterium sp.]
MNSKLKHYIDLIIVLTHKEMKIRYKSSFLGYIWSVAHPLAFALVFYIAFKVIMRINMEDYTLFLIAGLFPWQWFSNSVNTSAGIFLANASIIKKLNFPRNIVPLAMVLQDMIHFVFTIPVIIIFLFVYNKTPSLSWLYGIPILLSIQLLIVYGTSLMVSSLNLFFRDLERLVAILVTLLFYFTPIIYSETMIPEKFRYLIYLNPVAPLIISWRSVFLSGTLNLFFLIISTLYALSVFFLGYGIYKKLSWRFAEVL